jgi:xanthine dehydrogenase accessory factor
MKRTSIWSFVEKEIRIIGKVYIIIITETVGYAPGKTGAKIAISLSGNTFGTIGGGKAEFDLKNLVNALKVGEKFAQIIEYKFDNEYNSQSEKAICGGKQKFLIFEITNSQLKTIRNVKLHIRNHIPAIINFMSSGEIELMELNTSIVPKKHIPNEKIFYHEMIGNEPLVHIIGGGHVSLALSKLLRILNFYVIVYEERPNMPTIIQNTFANKIICTKFSEVHKKMNLTHEDYILIMTPGHTSDEIVLRNILNLKYKYLGLMASPQKSKLLKQKLLDDGYEIEKLNNIYSPVGIPINSHTPEEIAISITAQIISLQNS